MENSKNQEWLIFIVQLSRIHPESPFEDIWATRVTREENGINYVTGEFMNVINVFYKSTTRKVQKHATEMFKSSEWADSLRYHWTIGTFLWNVLDEL